MNNNLPRYLFDRNNCLCPLRLVNRSKEAFAKQAVLSGRQDNRLPGYFPVLFLGLCLGLLICEKMERPLSVTGRERGAQLTELA
jgi:hypothetical protein